MPQVKRSTALLVALGVIIILATVSGAFLMKGQPEAPPPEPEQSERSVYARGLVDCISRVSMPMPKVPGIVVSVEVKEGDEVKAGQPILKLNDKTAKLKLGEAESLLKAARHKLEQAELLPKKQQAEINQLEKAVELANSLVEQAKLALTAKESAFKAKLIQEEEVKAAAEAVKQAKIAQERAKQALTDLKDSKLVEKQIEEAKAQFKAAELSFEAAQENLESFVLRAPKDGYIERIEFGIGDSFPPVIPNRPPILFLPKEGLIVRAELDQDRALSVEKGMKVTLQNYSDLNSKKWTGTVVRLGRMFRRRQSVLLEPEMVNDARVLECVIEVDPEAEKVLKLGQQLRVQIHTSRK
jgi:multidrug resistance efflux pump